MLDRLYSKTGLQVPGYVVIIRCNVFFYFKIFMFFIETLSQLRLTHTSSDLSVTYHLLVDEGKLPLTTARSGAR